MPTFEINYLDLYKVHQIIRDIPERVNTAFDQALHQFMPVLADQIRDNASGGVLLARSGDLGTSGQAGVLSAIWVSGGDYLCRSRHR